MTCPDGTGFEASLEACDYVANVKACAKGDIILNSFQILYFRKPIKSTSVVVILYF
jgi:hypothetical protein